MRMLVTGANGQLGSELRRCLETMASEAGPIPKRYRGVDVDYIDCNELDIADGTAVTKWFSAHKPYDLVVNCAARTDVDSCEQNEWAAMRVNAYGAANLALAAESQDAALVHVSTDYVFPGDTPGPRTEDDPVRPLSAYGRTKLAGELMVQAACKRVFVVRTAWLYGYSGHNFVKTILRVAQERGEIAVVADQLGNPTNANDLAREVLRIAETDAYGIYHCTGKGECSWFDFASAIVDLAGVPCRKEALTTAEYRRRFPAAANRPAFSALDNARLRNTIGDGMRPWQDALSTFMQLLPQLQCAPSKPEEEADHGRI